jgi:hypothetical protein
MKAHVKTHEGYDAKSVANDCVWIKSVTLQFNKSKDGFMSLLDAQHSFLACKQSVGQSADEYAERLIGWAETIETHGGAVAANYKLIAETDPAGSVRSPETRRALARERTIATALICNADASRYGTLITDLANKYAMGKDEYPTNIASAKRLLVLYRTPTNAPAPRTGAQRTQPAPTSAPTANTETNASATILAQRASTPVAGTDGVTRTTVTCFLCNQAGHMQGECPTGQPPPASIVSGTTLTQYAFVLAQAAGEGEHGIDPDWILLDSQSTISVFEKPSFLTNIRRSTHVLRAITNGGHQDSNMVGDFPNLGEVWFNRDSIANILSLADVRKVCRDTMDTSTEPALLVHRLDGSIMKFLEHSSGLYIYKCNSTNDRVTGYYTMVSTVAKQKGCSRGEKLSQQTLFVNCTER